MELSRDIKPEATDDSAADSPSPAKDAPAHSSPPPPDVQEQSKPSLPFDSFATLMAAHTELLKTELSQDDAARPHFIERVREFIGRGTKTGTLLDDTDQRRTAQSLLNYWVTVLYRAEATPPADAILAYYSPRQDLEFECPYVGLSPYREADSARFFGREQLTSTIVQRLNDKNFVVLVGLSGSGKTSVLNAGVLPVLKNGTQVQETKDWTYFPSFTPGSDPLVSLASLFTEDVKATAERLLQKPDYLLELLKHPNFGDRPTIFVIDQFEEVFTWVKDDQRRDAFINALMSLKDSPIKHRLILAMRSDRINQIIRRPVLNELFREAEVRIDPLREASLREIIEKPAQKIGLKFQPGIVDQIIREIYAEPVPLPLLQFALLELWAAREGDTITWAALNRLGDFREALAAKADSFYQGLDPAEQDVARRILLRMVRLSNTWEATSEPVRRDDLYQPGEDTRRVNEVLAKLLSANLARISNIGRWLNLPASCDDASKVPAELPDDQFELSHESLARNWPELGSWLSKLREAMSTRQRLGLFAANWVILGRSEKGLLDKFQLHEAETWLASDEAKELGYDVDLEGLVKKSRETIDRNKLIQKLWYAGVGLLIVFGLGMIIFAFVLGEHRRLKQATSFRLAFQAGAIRSNQLDLAMLLNREAYLKDKDIPEAQNSLMRSLTYSPKLCSFLYNEKSSIRQIVFNEDGNRLTLLDSSGKVKFWHAMDHSPLGEVEIPSGVEKRTNPALDDASLPRLSRNGKYLFYMGAPGQLVIWDLDTRQQQNVPTSSKKAADWPIAFGCSYDNTKLAWLTPIAPETNKPQDTFELIVWDLVGQKKLAASFTKTIQKVVFSPDNQTLAVANADASITLLRAATLGPIGKLENSIDPSGSKRIVFSGNGNSLVSMNQYGDLVVWSTTDQRQLRSFNRDSHLAGGGAKTAQSGLHTRTLTPTAIDTAFTPSRSGRALESFALSPAGELLVAGYDDGTVIFWNVATGEQIQYTSRHKGHVNEIVFSADDKKMITAADAEGPILLWERMESRLADVSRTWRNTRELLGGLAGKTQNVTFSRDNSLIAGANITGGDDDGTVILWDLDQNLLSDGSGFSNIGTPQISNDAGSLFSLTESDEVVVTNIKEGTEVRRFSIGAHVGDVLFNKNGKVLAVRYQDNSVAAWDTGSGQRNVILNGTGDAQGNSIIGMAIDDAGSKLALGWSAGEIVILGIQDRKSQSIKYDPVNRLTLTFSSDGTKLASSDDLGKITIWDAVQGSQLSQRSTKDQTPSYHLAFTRDGTKLVCLTGDALTLWNPAGGDQEKILTKSLNISTFVMNPVSDSVAASGYDGSIIFWDLSKWAEQFTFSTRDVVSLAQGNDLTSLVFLPDGKRLAAGYSDGSVSLLVVDLNLWANRACSIANRRLTPAELKVNDVFADQASKFWTTQDSYYNPTCPKLPDSRSLKRSH